MRLAICASTLILPAALSGPASADCPGPGISLEPASPRSGDSLTVQGDGLYDGTCYDTSGGCHQPDKARPATGVRLELLLRERAFDLGEFDPGDDWKRTKAVPLPTGAVGEGQVRVVREDGSTFAAEPIVIR